MTGSRQITALCISATLLLVAAPTLAQDEGTAEPMDMDAATVEVTGVDYAYDGLPTSVPTGTLLTFSNDGTEYHEMIVVRIDDETTPLEELMQLPEEETENISEFVGFLSSAPGAAADGSISLDAPGRYVAICNIHQGSDPEAFRALGIDPETIDPETTDPSTLPPDAQELLAAIDANPPHLELGMIQEFTVTEAAAE